MITLVHSFRKISVEMTSDDRRSKITEDYELRYVIFTAMVFELDLMDLIAFGTKYLLYTESLGRSMVEGTLSCMSFANNADFLISNAEILHYLDANEYDYTIGGILESPPPDKGWAYVDDVIPTPTNCDFSMLRLSDIIAPVYYSLYHTNSHIEHLTRFQDVGEDLAMAHNYSCLRFAGM